MRGRLNPYVVGGKLAQFPPDEPIHVACMGSARRRRPPMCSRSPPRPGVFPGLPDGGAGSLQGRRAHNLSSPRVEKHADQGSRADLLAPLRRTIPGTRRLSVFKAGARGVGERPRESILPRHPGPVRSACPLLQPGVMTQVSSQNRANTRSKSALGKVGQPSAAGWNSNGDPRRRASLPASSGSGRQRRSRPLAPAVRPAHQLKLTRRCPAATRAALSVATPPLQQRFGGRAIEPAQEPPQPAAPSAPSPRSTNPHAGRLSFQLLGERSRGGRGGGGEPLPPRRPPSPRTSPLRGEGAGGEVRPPRLNSLSPGDAWRMIACVAWLRPPTLIRLAPNVRRGRCP